MLSTRSYYSPEVEFHRRSDRGVHLAVGQVGRITDQYGLPDGISNRGSPSADSDGKAGGPSRKRVPVACGRCRKRKIKCSGDDGDGRGCSNCRNSGNNSECAFLRVNSQPTFLNESVHSLPSTRAWQTGTRYNPYPPHSTARAASFTLPQSYGTSGYTSLHASLDYATFPAQPQYSTWARGQYSNPYGFSYDDDSPVSYSGQSPAYLLPSTDPSAGITGYLSTPVSPKSWDLAHQTSRNQQHGMYPEQSMTSPISASNMHFPPSGLAQASVSRDVQTTFSGQNGASTALPTSDRILPNPATSRAFMTGGGSASIDGLACNALSYRSVNPWPGTDAFSNSSQASNRTASTALSSSQDTNGRTSASPSSQDIGLGFIGISHTPQPTLTTTTSVVPMGPAEVSLLPNLRARCRTVSQENLNATEAHAGEGYTHYGDDNTGRRSTTTSISSGQLSNGEQYTPIRPAMDGKRDAFSDERYQSANYSHHLVHRTSIAALNNASGY